MRGPHSPPAVARWRLEYLRGRPERGEREREGVLRAEARRRPADRPVDARGPCLYLAVGRYSPHEYLRQIVSGVARPVPLALPADDAGGDRLFPEVALLQHARDVLVEPRDADAAGDPESLQT